MRGPTALLVQAPAAQGSPIDVDTTCSKRQRKASGTTSFVLNPLELPWPWLRLLIREHLTPEDRLLLFKTNKVVASMVLQHAPALRFHLSTLDNLHHTVIGESGGAPNWMSRRAQAIRTLLSSTPNVHLNVTLAWKFSTLWEALPHQCINELKLSGMPLGLIVLPARVQQLKLERCTRLHTLQLCACWDAHGTAPPSVPPFPPIPPVPFPAPSLKHLHIHAPCPLAARTLIRLLGAQLQRLDTQSLTDNMIMSLVAVSGVRVTTAALTLEKDHSKMQVRWESLEVTECVKMSDLLRLPVTHIKCLVLHEGVWTDKKGRAALEEAGKLADHLSKCSAIVCNPRWDPQSGPSVQQPFFKIIGATPALIDLCGSGLVDSCCLQLKDFAVPSFINQKMFRMQLPPRIASIRYL